MRKIIGALVLIFITAAAFLAPVSTVVRADGDTPSIEVTANDPNKIPLTDDLLRSEYRTLHETHDKMYDIFSKVLIGFIAIVMILVVFMIVKALRNKSDNDYDPEDDNARRAHAMSTATRWLPVFLVIPFVLGLVFVAYNFTNMSDSEPDPDKAEMNVYYVDVIRKEKEEHVSRDSNNHTTSTSYTYHLYIKSGGTTERDMRVSLSMYDSVTDPGIYYIAYAETDTQHYPFAIYPSDQYTPVSESKS